MNRKFKLLIVMIMMLCGTALAVSVPVQAADTAERTADWVRAAKLFSFYYQNLNSRYSFDGHEDQYIKNWQTWRRDVTALQGELKKKYGETVKEVSAKFEGVPAPEGVGNSMRQIAGDLLSFDFDAKEKEIAGWAATAGDKAYAKWKNFTPPHETKMELKVDYARRALAAYEFAAGVNPDGNYKDRIEKTRKAVAESEKVWKKAMADMKWPGHNKDFGGPGDPDDLAEEALKLLLSVDSWTKPEYDDKHFPISACVTGTDWAVYKKAPLTHIPTQYSLNFLVAFAGTKDPDIAYVYHMVFYTREEAGVKKESPFRYVNSRQYAKYKMLMSDIPKMIEPGASDVGGSRSSTSGMFGFIFRVLLSLALIAGGLILAENKIRPKLPQLERVFAILSPRKQSLGWAALAIGLFCFLRTAIIYFNPLSDLLPQVAAVFAGLVIYEGGYPAFIASRIKGLVEQLTAMTEPLGLVSVVLGLLHLIIGGVFLL